MSSKEIIASVFGCLIDCEGSLRYCGHTRSIRVRMVNESYLNDWNVLLKKIGIQSNVKTGELTTLTITSNQNFKKLKEFGFELVHKEKKERFEKMLAGYKKHQVERNTAKEFYLEKLKEIGQEISASTLAKKLKKSKRVVSHFLRILELEQLLQVNKNSTTYKYSV